MRLLLACLFMVLSVAWSADSVPLKATAATKSTIAYIPIATEISPLSSRYFRRALADAKAAGVTTVVVHLTTPGGRVDSAMEMTNAALSMPKDGPELVAFIDDHALSAGALIAYCHQRIYLSSRASIGDIGVIFQTQDGKIEYAPEKMKTVVRTLLRNAAQNRGWNEAKLVKMTARNQGLYRFDLPAGPIWVIEDDLPKFYADHPDIDKKAKVLILGEDRLLSYTAKEAVDEHMATGLVDNLDALYAQLGTTKDQVLDLSPTSTEEISWFLAGWAPMLAGLAVLFIILEFKFTSGGIFLILAAVAGLGFFVCQFYQDLAGYTEVILVVLGLLVIVLDIFVLPTGGWLSAIGLLGMAVGLVLSFMPDVDQFQPSTVGWGDQLAAALGQSVLALGMMAVGISVAISMAPRLKAVKRISVEATIDGTSAGTVASTTLAGRRGITRTGLSPSGFVTVDGQELSASSEHGEFIAPGAAIVVVEQRFGEVVVRPVAGEPV